MNNKEMINKILQYWYMVEFLSQEKFPTDNRRELKKYRETSASDKKKVKRLKVSSNITKSERNSICQIVEDKLKEYNFNDYGYIITVYIGKIKRDDCLNVLISKFGKDVNIPEASDEYVALAALQIDCNGEYIERTVSLSPLLWAVKQIDSGCVNMGKELDEEAYRISINNLDKEIPIADYKTKVEEDETKEDKNEEGDEEDNIREIFIDDLDDIYDYIYNEYIEGIYDYSAKEDILENKEYLIQYTMLKYENEIPEDEGSDIESFGVNLSKSFFKKDIKMLIEKNKNDELDETMQNYILSLYNSMYDTEDKSRVDLVHSDNLSEYVTMLNSILRMKNAPIGKWPSKDVPALMQQIAINMLTHDELREQLNGAGKVFSVNGPPGTGKTTLLKEIVANNVVERAVLLTEYEEPDKAFKKHKFKRSGPDKYTPNWYELDKKEINYYSILVASTNNAAVENISKELPVSMGEALCECDDERLKEIGALFSKGKSQETEIFFKSKNKPFFFNEVMKKATQKTDANDIYFTKYAEVLLGINNVWGLPAVALGRKSNIESFCYIVLENLLEDFLKKNSDIEGRLPKYRTARERFQKQYDKVCKIRERLDSYADMNSKFYVYSHFTKEKNDLEESIHKTEHQIVELEEEIDKLEKERIYYYNSIGIFSKLFKTRKYIDITKIIKKNTEKCEDIEKQISGSRSKLTMLEKYADELCERLGIDIENTSCLEEPAAETYNVHDKINAIEAYLTDVKEEYDRIMADFNAEQDKCIAIDENFAQRLLGEENESTEAHTCNPWTTEEYNREREKLFYYAMKLNKEFILSSKACRDNFKILQYYWGCSRDMSRFEAENEPGCVTAIMQTLFLLVPVISSTFASIGTFLKDINKSDVIGLLIVDEAGQAQPQAALGALYRSRKAMVVGDPKQIEPVVTNELDMLKKLIYNDNIYKPYTEKSVSVQNCADYMNVFGTYMDEDKCDWVGCPLLVHRRCISPMYDISNILSYNGMMKKKSRAPQKEQKFIYEESKWIDIKGKEKGNKNHFVKEQAEEVWKMLQISISASKYPDVFIISPFTTVVNGMKDFIISQNPEYEEWLKKHVGTVHTFQGKDAKEVIFLLGCDNTSKGAIQWVSKNIINVAVTRAKYRLYVVGDKAAWRQSEYMKILQDVLDDIK